MKKREQVVLKNQILQDLILSSPNTYVQVLNYGEAGVVIVRELKKLEILHLRSKFHDRARAIIVLPWSGVV